MVPGLVNMDRAETGDKGGREDTAEMAGKADSGRTTSDRVRSSPAVASSHSVDCDAAA